MEWILFFNYLNGVLALINIYFFVLNHRHAPKWLNTMTLVAILGCTVDFLIGTGIASAIRKWGGLS